MKINKFCFKFMPINLTTFQSNKFLVFLLNFHIHAKSLNFYNSFFNLFITKWTPNFLQFITNFFVTINFMPLNEIFFISMRRQLVSYWEMKTSCFSQNFCLIAVIVNFYVIFHCIADGVFEPNLRNRASVAIYCTTDSAHVKFDVWIN